MSFGGYKFKGYFVDNTKYQSNDERCLPVHAARVRAFLEASNLAGGPWAADPEWLNGEISINLSSGELTDNVSNGIIHKIFSPDNTLGGYASYFKYSSNDVTGYYYILTSSRYSVYYDESGSSNYSDYITINSKSIPITPPVSSSGNWNYAPYGASCLHCLSLDAFGNNLFNLIDTSSKSSRLQSVGRNPSTSQYPVGGGGFLSYSGKVYFGYAIKDKDIIAFSGIDESPFTTLNNSHVVVMSLDGFSELYSKDDGYPFLYLDIKNGSNSSSDGEQGSSSYKGYCDQILSTTGQPLSFVPVYNGFTYSCHFYVYIIQDPRASYRAQIAPYTPLSGLIIGLYDSVNNAPPFSNSDQCIKGCTNPELIANNVSFDSLNSSMYSTVFNGNMLYLYGSNGKDGFPCYDYGINNTFSKSNTSLTGYTNFYIGWDPSNPDIKTNTAWPEYSASLSS